MDKKIRSLKEGRRDHNLLKDFYNKMHIIHIKGLQHILRFELRLEINQEA